MRLRRMKIKLDTRVSQNVSLFYQQENKSHLFNFQNFSILYKA